MNGFSHKFIVTLRLFFVKSPSMSASLFASVNISGQSKLPNESIYMFNQIHCVDCLLDQKISCRECLNIVSLLAFPVFDESLIAAMPPTR